MKYGTPKGGSYRRKSGIPKGKSDRRTIGIGIDIGGTKISMVLGNARGRILARREIPTLKNSRVRQGLRLLIENLHQLIRDARVPSHQILGIGIGIPGAVNTSKGIVPNSPNLKGWRNLPLGRILTRSFGCPVILMNDANAAVVGEKIFGAARKAKHVIYLTISTGVGGGILIDERLVEGANFVAGEIGHMTIMPEGDRCNCGQRGCLEAYASGTAIGRYVEREIRSGRGHGIERWIPRTKGISGREVGLAAEHGNPLAMQAYRRAGNYLGVGIGTLLNILNPQVVVLGGGVLKSAPPAHWQAMLKSVKRHAWPEAFRAAKIVRTRLGDHVGNLGALALVFAYKKH